MGSFSGRLLEISLFNDSHGRAGQLDDITNSDLLSFWSSYYSHLADG